MASSPTRWRTFGGLLLLLSASTIRVSSGLELIRSNRALSNPRWMVSTLRGGSILEDDDDDDYDDEEEDEEYDEDVEEGDDSVVDDSDFEGQTLTARVSKAWRDTPPVTQVYVFCSLALTIGSWLMNDNVWPEFLYLRWKPTLTRMQIWRPLTSFLFYGPFGLSYLLTIHFVWTYMYTLEKLSHAEPWEFAMMLAFGGTLLLAGVTLGSMNSRFLGHNLSCFLVYIWARTFEGQEVSVMEFFNIKAELLPWFFAAQTYLLEQELPVSDLLGIAIGHLFVWTRQRDILRTPEWLINLYRNNQDIMAKYDAMADEFS